MGRTPFRLCAFASVRDRSFFWRIKVTQIPDHVDETPALVYMAMLVHAVSELPQSNAVNRAIPPSREMVMRRLIPFGGMLRPCKAFAGLFAKPLKARVKRRTVYGLAFNGTALETLARAVRRE